MAALASGRLRRDHREQMLTLGADMGFGRLDEILQPPLGCVRHAAAFTGTDRHPEFRCLVCHLWSLGDALVTGVAVDDLLLAMQQLGRWGEVVHVGGCGDHRMDQIRVLRACLWTGMLGRMRGDGLVIKLGRMRVELLLPRGR